MVEYLLYEMSMSGLRYYLSVYTTLVLTVKQERLNYPTTPNTIIRDRYFFKHH